MDKKSTTWKNPWNIVCCVSLFLFIWGCGICLFADATYGVGRVLKSLMIAGGILLLMGGAFKLLGTKRCLELALSEKVLLPLLVLTLGMIIAIHFMPSVEEINGAKRWIEIAGIRFQPSEPAKLLLIALGAKYLGPLLDGDVQQRIKYSQAWIPLVAGGAICGAVYFQPDMGTMALLAGLVVGIYFMSGMKYKTVSACVLAFVALMIVAAMRESYRMERFRAWFDPWAYRHDEGYQAVQSLITIGSGGFFGYWGQGVSKFGVPEAHTDYAFAVLCNEMGFFGFSILVILFYMLGRAISSIAFQAKSGRNFILCAGISLLIVGQAVANMAMVSGIFPVIGVPLPLISYGGTSLLTTLLSLGLVYAVHRGNLRGEVAQAPKRREELHVVSRRWRQHE